MSKILRMPAPKSPSKTNSLKNLYARREILDELHRLLGVLEMEWIKDASAQLDRFRGSGRTMASYCTWLFIELALRVLSSNGV